MPNTTIKIGNIIKISKGKKAISVFANPIEGSTRYLQIDDLRNNNNLKYTDEKGVFVTQDDIIIAWDGAKAGTVGYGLTGIIGSTLAKLEIKNTNQFLPQYLGIFLKSKFQYLQDRCTGATIPHINKQALKDLQLRVLPVEAQKQVVSILQQIEILRQKRNQAIGLLDEYLKSVFLEMFGDPVTNPKGWEKQKFQQLGKLDRGISKHRPRNAPELLGGDHPLIQTGDIANCGIYIEKFDSTYSDIGLAQSKKWPKGTLCITIAANIARTGILSFETCFPDSVVGFIADKNKTTNEFIHFWMSFFQQILEQSAPESAQKNINLKILRDLDVITPPIEEQRKFSDIVVKAESTRKIMLAQSNELDTQFLALTQSAFK